MSSASVWTGRVFTLFVLILSRKMMLEIGKQRRKIRGYERAYDWRKEVKRPGVSRGATLIGVDYFEHRTVLSLTDLDTAGELILQVGHM